MKGFTVAVYAVFGVLALAAGLVAFVMPAVALPANQLTQLTSHLTRELSSAFVFIGLMFFWCVRHYPERRPVHMAFSCSSRSLQACAGRTISVQPRRSDEPAGEFSAGRAAGDHGAVQAAMNLDAAFRPVRRRRVLRLIIADRAAVPDQIAGDRREAGSDAGGASAMLIGLRLAGAALWGGGDRLHGEPGGDGVVGAAAAGLGVGGRASALVRDHRVPLLIWTLRSLGPEPDRHGGDAPGAHAGHARPVRSGPPSVLRLHGAVHHVDRADGIELVSDRDRRRGVLAARDDGRGPRKTSCWRGSASRIAPTALRRAVSCRKYPDNQLRPSAMDDFLDFLPFAFLWLAHVVITSPVVAPLVWFTRRRVKWHVWELAVFIVPFGVWLGLMYTGHDRKHSRIWVSAS